MSKHCYTHMSVEERETLSLGLAQGLPLRVLARVLGGAPSTVSREYMRNARGIPYRACMGSAWRQPERVSRGDPANSWTRGSGSMSAPTWARGIRPNRLPGGSDTRILTTCGGDSRQRPSMQPCMYCRVEACAPSCWPHCGRRARPASLGREEPIDGATSRT